MDPKKLRLFVRWALRAIAGIVATADVVAFVESYWGLRQWAVEHGLHGFWAWIWPLQVDAFILVGELVLVVAVLKFWKLKAFIVGGLITFGGAVVSVLGNVGHVHSKDQAIQLTAAVPPLAATAGLAVGAFVLKQVLLDLPAETEDARPEPVEDVRPVATAVVLSPDRPRTEKASWGRRRSE